MSYKIRRAWRSNWREDLAAPGVKPDGQALTARLTQISTVEEVTGLRECVSFSVIPVLADSTSSEKVARLYSLFLSKGINIVTPNEKTLSTGLRSGASFYNESTSMGQAGLPIISTIIRDLVATGNKVRKVICTTKFLSMVL